MMSQKLIDKVFSFTVERALFSAPCHVLLGLSGGADSMALLHMLTHWPMSDLRVSAVHIHHGLRGEEADQDEAFVREYCAKNQTPLIVIHADVAAIAREQRLSLEEAGRRVRYEQFEAVCDAVGADYVLTAHTATDQVETMLMHMVRGCGVDGLAGIPALRGRIRRPLLCCQRHEIEQYCCENEIPFVTDSTNHDVQYTRNDVRHRILPLLREMNPSVDNAFLRLNKYADEESAYLNEVALTALKSAQCADGYCAEAFVVQPAVIRRRMIRLLLRKNGVPTIEEVHILMSEKVVTNGNGSVDLTGPFVFSVQQGVVSVRGKSVVSVSKAVAIDVLPRTGVFNEWTYSIDISEDTDVNVHNLFLNCAVDYDKIQGKLCLRCRESGDYFHAVGRSVGKSLKKWMNEWHIPAHKRDSYPLLCDDLGVILVPGYACDERVRVTEDTKHFLVCKTVAE